jgi:hypothetical protein
MSNIESFAVQTHVTHTPMVCLPIAVAPLCTEKTVNSRFKGSQTVDELRTSNRGFVEQVTQYLLSLFLEYRPRENHTVPSSREMSSNRVENNDE